MAQRNFTYLTLRHNTHIARVELHRPPVNALNREFVDQLTQCARTVRRLPDVWVVLVTSRLEVFCAGADLKDRASLAPAKVPAAVRNIQAMVKSWIEIPQPVIAAVNGAALGGGLEFALAADLIAAADNVQLGFPEVTLGIIPGAGGTQLMLRRTTGAAAKKWILSGNRFTAQEALRDGVVDYVFPVARFNEVVEQLTLSIVSNAPIALRQAKKVIAESDGAALQRGFKLEQQCYFPLVKTDDRREALKAFLEKRKPEWKGK